MKPAFVVASLAVAVLGVVAKAQTPSSPAFLASDLSPWQPVGKQGVSRMRLVGGEHPSTTEIVVYRERYPATFMCDSSRLDPHRHIGPMHLQVLRGTLNFGFGDTVNVAKAKAYGPKSFIEIPGGLSHFEWNRGELEIQVTAAGLPTVAPVRLADGRVDRSSGPTFTAAPCSPTNANAPAAAANGLPEWQPMSTGSLMKLVGDGLSPTDLYVYRMVWNPNVMQDSTRPIYHYHWGTEHVTIWRGGVRIGLGFPVDLSKAKLYGPGSFVHIPAGAPHFEWFVGEVEAQVEYLGSPGAVNLDPKTGLPR